jgi:hypothetical protein
MDLTYDCAACHQPSTQPHFGESCESCHTPDGFELANLEDYHPAPLEGNHATLDCAACHGANIDLVFECAVCHQPPQDHAETACDTCHTPEGWAQSVTQILAQSPQIPHALEGLEDCQVCHSPSGEALPAPADHVGFVNEVCTLCHKEAP